MKTTITILSTLIVLGFSNAFAQKVTTNNQALPLQRGGSFSEAATKPNGIKASSVLEPLAEPDAAVPTLQSGGNFTAAATKPAGRGESSVLEPLEESIPIQNGGTFTDAATKPSGIAKSSVLEPMESSMVNIASK